MDQRFGPSWWIAWHRSDLCWWPFYLWATRLWAVQFHGGGSFQRWGGGAFVHSTKHLQNMHWSELLWRVRFGTNAQPETLGGDFQSKAWQHATRWMGAHRDVNHCWCLLCLFREMLTQRSIHGSQCLASSLKCPEKRAQSTAWHLVVAADASSFHSLYVPVNLLLSWLLCFCPLSDEGGQVVLLLSNALSASVRLSIAGCWHCSCSLFSSTHALACGVLLPFWTFGHLTFFLYICI